VTANVLYCIVKLQWSFIVAICVMQLPKIIMPIEVENLVSCSEAGGFQNS